MNNRELVELLLAQLLEAGLRVPPTVTVCKGYLLSDVEMFKMLLASGMSPDLPNWQRQTLLHDVCGGGGRGKAEKQLTLARILLDAGATISAREEVYRSTPLAFAARTTCRIWWSFCYLAARRRIFPTTNRGRHRLRGRSGGGIRRSRRF